MTVSRFVRLQLPVLVLAAVAPLLALRFGGYHVRTGGWIVLGLALWASVLAARGRLSAPRSVAGVATFSLLGLVAWTTLSIAWVDVSRHDAWVEAVRALGYASAFVLGGALLANARSYVRFATLTGFGIALLAVGTCLRVARADAPLRSFTAGRLDWPVGYAPGLAALYLLGALLLLGTACGAERAWRRDGGRGGGGGGGAGGGAGQLLLSGAALGGAGACAALALLAQSRGTLPALAVAVVVAVVATPMRASLLLRLGALGAGLFATRGALAAVYQSQFDLRQAPFTKGADEDALLEAARQAAQHAAGATLVLVIVLAAAGAALVLAGAWISDRVESHRARTGTNVLVPVGVLAGTMLLVLVVLFASRGDRSPGSWAADQWRTCIDPVEQVNDPGSSTSYFANTGTGRCDYYRVALHGFREHPVLGLGAGNFRGEYVRERRTGEEPRVVHSLPLQLLAELGIVGAALGAAVLGCVLLAATRFLRSGSARDPVFAGAVAALAYWATHASIDWLWQLPAVSLPAFVLAGGLVACVSPAQGRVRAPVAAPVAAGAMLACIALVLPVTMADAALRRARDPELRREHPADALEAARDAQAFDPTWAEPFIVEGSIQAVAGHREQAAAAGRRAIEAEPGNWAVQYRASGLVGLDDTQDGRDAFLAARRLNPRLPARVNGAPAPVANPDSLQNPDA